jgi:putative lipoprotein
MDKLLLCLCFQLGGGNHAPKVPDRFFGEDKLQHFFASFLVTGVSGGVARLAGADRETSLWIGVGTGLAAGAVKELADARNPRETASLLDLAWDAGGVGFATAVAAQAR